jgi:hypothetical protein
MPASNATAVRAGPGTGPCRPRHRSVPPVVLDAVKIALILIPRYVRWMIIAEEHGALLRCALDPTGAASPGLDATEVDAASAPGVGSGIGRPAQQLPQRLAVGRVPLQLPLGRPGGRTKRQRDLMVSQVAQQAADAADRGELIQDQSHHVLDLRVGIELQFGVGADDEARRRLAHPLATAGAAEATGLHPLLDLVQFDPSRETLNSQKYVVVEISWMIQTVLVGQQGVEGGADLDQAATGLVLAGEAIDLEAEDQPDMAQGDLGEQPGEIVAAGGGGGGATLIAVEDADSLGGPAPLEGPLAEIELDLGGFAVALHLLGMRLPDIDDRPTVEMAALDLGGPGGVGGLSAIHRPPPLVRLGRRRGGGAGSSASGGPPGFAGPRGPTPASGVSAALGMCSESWTGGCRGSRLAWAHGWRPSVKSGRCWHQRASSRSVATETTGRADGVTIAEVRLVDPEASARDPLAVTRHQV